MQDNFYRFSTQIYKIFPFMVFGIVSYLRNIFPFTFYIFSKWFSDFTLNVFIFNLSGNYFCLLFGVQSSFTILQIIHKLLNTICPCFMLSPLSNGESHVYGYISGFSRLFSWSVCLSLTHLYLSCLGFVIDHSISWC